MRTRRTLWLFAIAACALAGCAAPGTTVPATSAPATSQVTPGRSSAAVACQERQDHFQANVFGFGPHALTAVRFVTARRGWVAGLDRLLATADGGRHWVIQASGRLDLTSLDFISASTGWAVGGSALLATTDGGARWTALPQPCPLIRSVDFTSATNGIAVAGGVYLGANGPAAEPLSGGVLLRTGDGGRTWTPAAGPADAQSVCLGSGGNGWLGAGGTLYRTADGGRTWVLAWAGTPAGGGGYETYTMTVQCGGSDSAWAVLAGSSGAMSQDPHTGFAAAPDRVVPVFAEQYFPHPGVRVSTAAPGSYPGAMSVLGPGEAVFVEACPACGPAGTVPWAVASVPGPALRRAGVVAGIGRPSGAWFLSAAAGWVTGVVIGYRDGRISYDARVVGTSDGGRTWRVGYRVTSGA